MMSNPLADHSQGLYNKKEIQVCQTRILPLVESPSCYYSHYVEISIDNKFYIVYSDSNAAIEEYIEKNNATIIGEMMIQTMFGR